MVPKHFVVVVNPRGGTLRGPQVLDEVQSIFKASGAMLDVHLTTHAGHAQELARTMDLTGCDGFCVVGGDGTIHEAVNGLMRRDDPEGIPLGVIPGGTGNSVLQHLKCVDPLEAARRIVEGKTQTLDVIRVTAGDEIHHCVNIVGWGAVVDINRTAERMRGLGPPRYALAATLHILRSRFRYATIMLDDRRVEDDFLFAAVCNTRFTGKGMLLAPHAEFDDGLIDVVLVRRTSRIQMLKLFHRIFDGSHLPLDCVDYRQVRAFQIEDDSHESLNLDGEIGGRTPVLAEVIPAAIRIFA